MKKHEFRGEIEEVPTPALEVSTNIHPAALAEFEHELEYLERTGFEIEDTLGDNIVAGFESILRYY